MSSASSTPGTALKRFLFIDTNIFVRFISQGKAGCEPELLADLRRLICSNELTLLLPEVVLLELEKNWRSFEDTVREKVGTLEQALEKALGQRFWSEIDELPEQIRQFVREKKKTKIELAQVRHKEINRLLKHPQIVRLPLTPEISFQATKRIMAGRMPVSETRAHSDACIIETLACYFSTTPGLSDSELHICTDNIKDFGLETSDGFSLHPLLKDDLQIPATLYRTLREAIEAITTHKPFAPPSPEAVEDALQEQAMQRHKRQQADESCIPRPIHCFHASCTARNNLISPYCNTHFWQHLDNMPTRDRAAYELAIVSSIEDIIPSAHIEPLRLHLIDHATPCLELDKTKHRLTVGPFKLKFRSFASHFADAKQWEEAYLAFLGEDTQKLKTYIYMASEFNKSFSR